MSVAKAELQRLGGLGSVIQLLISSSTSKTVRCELILSVDCDENLSLTTSVIRVTDANTWIVRNLLSCF